MIPQAGFLFLLLLDDLRLVLFVRDVEVEDSGSIACRTAGAAQTLLQQRQVAIAVGDAASVAGPVVPGSLNARKKHAQLTGRSSIRRI